MTTRPRLTKNCHPNKFPPRYVPVGKVPVREFEKLPAGKFPARKISHLTNSEKFPPENFPSGIVPAGKVPVRRIWKSSRPEKLMSAYFLLNQGIFKKQFTYFCYIFLQKKLSNWNRKYWISADFPDGNFSWRELFRQPRPLLTPLGSGR